MQFCEFCEKEVISVRDCRKLGNVYDMEFDACSGCICKLIVREHSGLLGFYAAEKRRLFHIPRSSRSDPTLFWWICNK